MDKIDIRKIEEALAFTEAFRCFENEDIAIREAMCLKAQYPAILQGIQENDLYAGRSIYSYAGFKHSGLQGDFGYYCDKKQILKDIDDGLIPQSYHEKLYEMIDFWKGRTATDIFKALDNNDQPTGIKNALVDFGEVENEKTVGYAAFYIQRMAEINLDFEKLLKIGLPGMFEMVRNGREKAVSEKKDDKIFTGMELCLDLFADMCRYYSNMALEKAAYLDDGKRKYELVEMSSILLKIIDDKPGTLREATQLFWIYAILSGVDNFGRMDMYLGDFYANDLDSGRIDKTEATRLIQSLWRQIASIFPISGRVVIGGMGRPNEKNADRFALEAIEATRVVKEDSPQLSLRFYKGMNPEIYEKALDSISEGRTFPMLYNDDTNVPAVANAFNVSMEEAKQYIQSNCGEFSIDHKSISSPNSGFSYLKVLEVTLFNGIDLLTGKPMGIETGKFSSFQTFDEFWSAYRRQLEFLMKIAADKVDRIYKTIEKTSCHLFACMLFDDCIEKGTGLVQGARYKGTHIEAHSCISAADSITAIKQLVYEKKEINPKKLLEILRANFTGYEKERHMMLGIPKYGNDEADADNMAVAVYDLINKATNEQGKRLNLHFALATHISVDLYVYLGKFCGASADGRMAFKPTTNGNNPIPGNDRNAITSLLNSMVKLKPSNTGGQTHHLKFGKDLFKNYRDKLEALLNVYFDNGGSQLSIAVMDRGDLENAMKEPEKYADLMVRVGGFSARFVTLPRELQEDIMARTIY